MLQSHGETPAARRAFLGGLGVEGIAERLVAAALRLREARARRRGTRALAEAVGLPEGEVVASPMALQIASQAAAAGITTRHRELRRELDWPTAFGPDESVADPDHGRWIRGKLHAGSYRAFRQDEPFGSFDPAHVSKWGPHELAHRLVGFFHRRDMSRWELYLGARLNELVPVMLWYGPEQALRGPAEVAFDRVDAGKRPGIEPWQARWVTNEEAVLRRRSLEAARRVQEGLAYFTREWAAIEEELRTGRRVRVPHPVLDASSDATAYVVGHHRRLTHPRVATVLERVVPDGCRVETLDAYRDRVERVLDRLLGGPPADVAELNAAKHRSRLRWDLWLRAAHCADVPDAALERVESASDAAPRSEIEAALPAEAARRVLLDGSPEGSDVDSVLDGVESVAPAAREWLAREPVAAAIAGSSFRRRAPLVERLGDALRADAPGRMPDGPDLDAGISAWKRHGSPVVDLLRWEAALASAGRDDAIERLTEDPERLPAELAAACVVRSEHALPLGLGHDVLPLHARFMDGEDISPRDAEPGTNHWLVVGQPDGGVAVIPAPAGVRRAWDRLAEGAVPAAEVVELLTPLDGEVEPGWPETGRGWLEELLAARVFGWRPELP